MSNSKIFNQERKFKHSPEEHVIENYPERLEHFQSGLDKPYTFEIFRHAGTVRGIKGLFDIIFHKTKNIDSEKRVCSAMVYLILVDEDEDITDQTKRKLIANLFTTNDFTLDDSFSRSFGKMSHAFDVRGNLRTSCGRTIEQGAICEDKTRVNNVFIKAAKPEEIYNTMAGSRFTDPDRLLQILGHRALSYPEPSPEFTKSDLKQYKKDKLDFARSQMITVPYPVLKDRILADNYRNLDLPPSWNPKRYKEAGRTLTFVGANGDVWDTFAGLIFLLRTLEAWKKSPLNAQLALATVDAFYAEVTPHDAKYGVVPPKTDTGVEQKLDNLINPKGLHWIFNTLLAQYMTPQEEFCTRLKFQLDNSAATENPETKREFDENAYFMLTEGFRGYVGLLGTIKRVARMLVIKDMTITPGLQAMIDESLAPYDINTTFYLPQVVLDPTMEDTFLTLQRIGTHEDPVSAGRTLSI